VDSPRRCAPYCAQKMVIDSRNYSPATTPFGGAS